MKFMQLNPTRLALLAMLFATPGLTPDARANVYATNIKLNGGLANLSIPPGQPVTISYILNEPASLGVTLDVLSGATVVRSLSLPAGAPGALAGTNSVVWDGNDASSNSVPFGTYAIRITAATSGYTNWQQISTDSADNTFVNGGRGIDVDRNTNSVYYGRIFVANALGGAGTQPGWQVGILKFNADTSVADEGFISQDGYNWAGNSLSPWKLQVAADDMVYVNDFNQSGLINKWDPTFSSNSLAPVLRADNLPPGAQLRGQALSGTATNLQLFMADDVLDGLGLARWSLTNGACATNDTGTSIVGLDTNFVSGPADVALDPAGNFYTCQSVSDSSNPIARVFCYPAYDPSTNGPENTPTWAIGQGDDNYGGANGLAVDPTGTYVAVAFEGVLLNSSLTNGCTRIFYTTNGALAADIDLNVPMDLIGDPEHDDLDCAWDAVGNLYYIDDWYGYWRVFSPPGTNQASTVAAIVVQVQLPAPPTLTSVAVNAGTVTIGFTAGTNDAPANFTLVSAVNPAGPYATASGYAITQISPGVFQATVPVNGPIQFYRVRR